MTDAFLSLSKKFERNVKKASVKEKEKLKRISLFSKPDYWAIKKAKSS